MERRSAGVPAAEANRRLGRRGRIDRQHVDGGGNFRRQGGRPVAAAGGKPGKAASKTPVVEGFDADPRPAPVLEIKGKGKAFVDFQHDVTADDVRLARTEGFVSVEHLKRYTTLGMATDQGKTSNMPGLAIMAAELGKTIPGGRHNTLPPALRARVDRLACGGTLWRI